MQKPNAFINEAHVRELPGTAEKRFVTAERKRVLIRKMFKLKSYAY